MPKDDQARAERLAQALRDNLHRRKAQRRAKDRDGPAADSAAAGAGENDEYDEPR